MCEQTGDDGRSTCTVQQIADGIGVKRITLNGYLNGKTTDFLNTYEATGGSRQSAV
ncbi:hypothetical protein [Streptosporangium roseum]|uniref:hypothetical protein n=1 Tax=Streptosporangium roseum TaxID=2001 RepID=UPI00331F91A9